MTLKLHRDSQAMTKEEEINLYDLALTDVKL